MKRLHFIGLLFLATMSSCGLQYSATERQIRKAELINSPINDTIQAINRLGLYVVYVKINEHEEPLEMIFDTGANLTVLTLEAAKKLNLESTGGINLGDSQGQRQSIPLVMIDELQLGAGMYHNVIAAVIDFPENSTITCLGKDGILGYHVIRQMQWAVHPGDTLLVGSTEDLRSGRPYTEVPMKGWKAPLIDVGFKEVLYLNTLFDSGSTGGLDLQRRFVSKVSDSIPLVKTIDGTSQGVYGNILDTTLEVMNSDISLQGLHLPSDVEYSSNGDRKIGMRTLGPYHLIIDGPGGSLAIGELERELRPTMRYALTPNLQDTTLYVASMILNEETEALGVPHQQRLVSVNGITGSQMAEMDCGYLNFITSLREGNLPLILELPSGEVIRLEKQRPLGELIHSPEF